MKTLVLDYLSKFPEGKGPTQIGLALGKNYQTASSAVMPALKALVKEGLVERFKNGGVKYRLVKN